MTVVNKEILPALHNSGKVKDPDLQEIGEKNYTSTILRYANLAMSYPQLETDAKQVIPAINEAFHAGGTSVIPNPPMGSTITAENGDVLEAETGDSLEFDGPGGGGSGSVVGQLYAISIDGDIYTVSGGSGADVEANPDTYASTLLSSLRVNSETYWIPYIAEYTGNLFTSPLYKVVIGNTRYHLVDSTIVANPSLYPTTPQALSEINIHGTSYYLSPIASKTTYSNANSGLSATTVQAAIDEIVSTTHVYITTEHIVGTWIDDKDLYERSYSFNGPSSNAFQRVDLEIPRTSIDKAWIDSQNTFANKSTLMSAAITYYDGAPKADQFGGYLNYVQTNLSFDYRVGSDLYDSEIYLTIRYTKQSS